MKFRINKDLNRILEVYGMGKMRIDIESVIENDPIFPKYLDSYVPQDVEHDPLKKAF